LYDAEWAVYRGSGARSTPLHPLETR